MVSPWLERQASTALLRAPRVVGLPRGIDWSGDCGRSHGPSRGQRENLARRADLVRRQGQGLRDARRPSPRRRASLGVASPALRRTGGLDQLRSRALLPASLRRREGWVGVVLDTGPDWHAVAALARDVYLSVAT